MVTASVDAVQVLDLMALVQNSLGAESLEQYFHKVDDFLSDRMVDRFAVEGDDASGQWPPLTETTIRLKEAMGASGDEINVRTGDLIHWMVETSDIDVLPSAGGMLEKPSRQIFGDAIATKKLTTAQEGTNVNPMFPGAVTPPRPVAVLSDRDCEDILQMLMTHIMTWVVAGAELSLSGGFSD
jgi:hypothetical protein